MNSLIKSPPEQAPLSNRNAYTTWPGGVDPTVPLYNTDNQKFGGARNTRRNARRSRRISRRNARRSRRSSRRNARRNRKINRKVNRKNTRRNNTRKTRMYYGGYQTCSPIDTLGSRASIPMTASVCPEGYFKTLDTLIN